MKFQRALLALAAFQALAGTAFAQSSVTISGAVDEAARYVKNSGGDSLKSLISSGNTSSRLAFSGLEDLGDGFKVGFWLETDLNPDVGTAGGSSAIPGATGGKTVASAAMWNRRSTLSLINPSLGEVRLGRDYTPTFSNQAAYDPFGNVGLGASFGISRLSAAVPDVSTFARTNNGIAYYLPSAWDGWYGRVQVAAGEGAVNAKFVGGNFGYLKGPVRVSVATSEQDLPVGKYKSSSVGGWYDFGVARVQALYVDEKAASLNFEEKRMYLASLIPVGVGQIKVQFGQTKISNTNDKAQLLAIGYVYNLSKRTALYTTAAQISNKGNLAIRLGGATIEAQGKSRGVEAGITHFF